MDNILKIHKLNLITDLGEFFKAHNHLRFKLVMMDAGMYDVMKAAIPFFWERLNPGGIMIFRKEIIKKLRKKNKKRL